MSDALDVLDQVGKWKASGKGVAVATVITTWGSSPRPVGSQLGVDETGAMVGSVSGGADKRLAGWQTEIRKDKE